MALEQKKKSCSPRTKKKNHPLRAFFSYLVFLLTLVLLRTPTNNIYTGVLLPTMYECGRRTSPTGDDAQRDRQRSTFPFLERYVRAYFVSPLPPFSPPI